MYHPSGLVVALHLGIVATAIACPLFGSGLSLILAASAMTLSLAEPLTAGVPGVAVVGEKVTPMNVAGAILILVGLLVLSLSSKKKGHPM